MYAIKIKFVAYARIKRERIDNKVRKKGEREKKEREKNRFLGHKF